MTCRPILFYVRIENQVLELMPLIIEHYCILEVVMNLHSAGALYFIDVTLTELTFDTVRVLSVL